jgi:hypothetical protein
VCAAWQDARLKTSLPDAEPSIEEYPAPRLPNADLNCSPPRKKSGLLNVAHFAPALIQVKEPQAPFARSYLRKVELKAKRAGKDLPEGRVELNAPGKTP